MLHALILLLSLLASTYGLTPTGEEPRSLVGIEKAGPGWDPNGAPVPQSGSGDPSGTPTPTEGGPGWDPNG